MGTIDKMNAIKKHKEIFLQYFLFAFKKIIVSLRGKVNENAKLVYDSSK